MEITRQPGSASQLDEMATFSTQSLDSNSCACIRRRPWHDIVKISRLVVKYGDSIATLQLHKNRVLQN